MTMYIRYFDKYQTGLVEILNILFRESKKRNIKTELHEKL